MARDLAPAEQRAMAEAVSAVFLRDESTPATPAASAASSQARTRSGRWGAVLPEIQALRAIAVLLVVVYHLWPERIPGGFVGVDVFFAISGFLITGHLVKSLVAEGRVSVVRFWSHRIWRLIPASLFVLAVCLIFTIVATPAPEAGSALRQIAGAGAYVVNWLLAGDTVDYLARDSAPTLVQHYWSLSVEEQFYLMWPLLLALVVAVIARRERAVIHSPRRARRVSAQSRRRALLIAVSIVVVASLIYSVVSTQAHPQRAYFDTFTRVWEFGLGGIAALLMGGSPSWLSQLRSHRLVQRFALPTWIGLALIAGAALGMSNTTPFPSFWASIPVIGTLLVIIGGSPTQDRILARALQTRPVQFLGDVSYSLYLWHWPLIVGFAIVVGRPHETVEGVALGLVAVGLAGLTKVFIEDPFRALGRTLTRVWPAFVLLLIAAALVIAPAIGTTVWRDAAAQALVVEREESLFDVTSCIGAHATLGDGGCADPFVITDGIDPVLPYVDVSEDWCLTGLDQDWLSCDLGDVDAPHGTIALVGDAHAAALAVPMGAYYAQHGWRVVTMTRFGCPALSETPIGVARQTPEAEQACASWTRRVTQELVERTDIDIVVYTAFEQSYSVPEAEGAVMLDVASIADTLTRVDASGKDVVLLRDVAVISPGDMFRDAPACVEVAADPATECSIDISTAFPTTPQSLAVPLLPPSVRTIDLRGATCDEARCYSVVGDVVAYADYNRMSDTFARTLMPYLGAAITGPAR